MRIIRKLKSVIKEEHYFRILTDAAEIRLWFLTDDILRIRAGFDEDFDEASYSLVMTAWEDRTDELFKKERNRITAKEAELEQSEENTVIRGKRLKAVIHPDPFYISIYDCDGTLIHEDIPGLSYREDMNHRRIHTSRLEETDHYYGFGETTGELDKKEACLNLNAGDSIGYNPKKTDGMYKYIPFYIRLSEKTKQAVGYYYHGMAPCTFNLGRERKNYWHRFSSYTVDAGDIDLFLITGPKVSDIIRRYTDLTGKSAMLPGTGLGYLGSSMYYPELPDRADEAILKFADNAVEEGMAMSGFQLSSGYCNIETQEGLKRCVFTWNERRFPDPSYFFSEMTKRGIRVSANVKPGILTCHPLYEEMKEKGMFVRKAGEKEPEIGAWWGGPGSFMDYTDEETRKNWKKYLKTALLDYGCTSVWNDNCEYDSLADLDAEVSYEGEGGNIRLLKPAMANLMCLLSNEAMEEVNPDLRPFSVCRAGMPGIQRYAQVWTGDNRTGWDSLKYNIATMLGLGLSGVANVGSDVGGFFGPAPEKELFVRWIQHGIFMPRFSIHSANTDNTVTEAWMYEDAADIIREAFDLRKALMPYIYSLMYRAHTQGLPYMQPLLMKFQKDTRVYNEGVDFMLGESLLVANVVEEGAEERSIYLPEGASYYDFYTRKKYEGGKSITVPVTLSDIPLYLVSGAILPMMTPLFTIRIIPDTDASFVLYEDEPESNAYLEGDCLKTEICVMACKEGDKTVRIKMKKNGNRDISFGRSVTLDVLYPENAPYRVRINTRTLPGFIEKKEWEKADEGWYYHMGTRSVLVKYKEPREDLDIEIICSPKDLIGM